MKFKELNLPNKLTVLRLFAVPLCVLAVMLPEKWVPADVSAIIALVIFIAASLTDMLDGKIARKYNLITDFGKFLDPLADKFMVIGTMLAIVCRNGFIRPWFFWVVLIVIFREFAVTSLRLIASTSGGVVVAAAWLGKVKTTVQMITVCAALLEPVIYAGISGTAGEWLQRFPPLTCIASLLTAYFTIVSGIDYIRQLWKYLDAEK